MGPTAGKPRVVIIVQARMGSTRLPGKILKTVLGKTLLEFELERLMQVKLADEVVVATTVDSRDDPVERLCRKLKLNIFRGSEDDVLSRYYEAAKKFDAQIVVRVTADCPLIDPAVVDQILHTMIECKLYQYVSNTLHRTFPRGLDVEAFYFDNLRDAHERATEKSDREHVTLYMHRSIRHDLIRNISNPSQLSEHRWTVDTPEDFELVKRILESLYPENRNFCFQDVVQLLAKHPEWVKINAHVEQKAH